MLPFDKHSVEQLTTIQRIMNIKATRQDGGNRVPLKEDRVRSLEEQTAASVKARVDVLKEQLTSVQT